MFTGKSQEKFSRVHRFMEDYWHAKKGCVSLADGHGGHVISQLASAKIVDMMDFVPETEPVVIEEAYAKNFQLVHDSMKDHDGGATLTSAFIGNKDGQKFVTVANVGDSPAFLFPIGEPGKFHELTTSHNPDTDGKRIVETKTGAWCSYNSINGDKKRFPIFDESGNKIEYPETREKLEKLRNEWSAAHSVWSASRTEYKTTTTEENKTNMEKNKEILDVKKKEFTEFEVVHNSSPDSQIVFSSVHLSERACYFFCPDGFNGIGVTRAIGDFGYVPFGLIPEPSVRTTFVTEPSILFIASDGVTDCFECDELSKLVVETESDDELLAIFCKKSASLYGKQHDDISFVRACI